MNNDSWKTELNELLEPWLWSDLSLKMDRLSENVNVPIIFVCESFIETFPYAKTTDCACWSVNRYYECVFVNLNWATETAKDLGVGFDVLVATAILHEFGHSVNWANDDPYVRQLQSNVLTFRQSVVWDEWTPDMIEAQIDVEHLAWNSAWGLAVHNNINIDPTIFNKLRTLFVGTYESQREFPFWEFPFWELVWELIKTKF